jgi:uncharacterized UPF0160 family protein
MKPIITHAGAFHADEVGAVALLSMAGLWNGHLVRTRDESLIQAGLADNTAWVLDVGGEFDPAKLNFDHHQALDLPSAAGLIWAHVKHVFGDGDELKPLDDLIVLMDKFDVNRGGILGRLRKTPDAWTHISWLVSGFNRDISDDAEQMQNFLKAVGVMQTVFENQLFIGKSMVEEEAVYARREVLPNGVALFDKFCRVWRDKGEHRFVVMPAHRGWQLLSSENDIPEKISEIRGFKFRHLNGFIAVVDERASLVEFVQKLV